jgi:hypothetical protein
MSIAYVAQTRDHLLMLDEEGVCLHVHKRSKDRGHDAVDGAIRCIGAQFVAALDPSQPGFLGHAPALGVPMLFAKVGPAGKISLVRTGPLERFENQVSEIHEQPTRVALEPRSGKPDSAPPTSSKKPESHTRLRPIQDPAIRYLRDDEALEDDEPTVRFPAHASRAISAAAFELRPKVRVG